MIRGDEQDQWRHENDQADRDRNDQRRQVMIREDRDSISGDMNMIRET